MADRVFIKVDLKNIINVTRVITINRYRLAPIYRNKGELHDFWEMVYVEHGSLGYHAGDRPGRLRKGEVLFHRPNEFHNIECDGKNGATIFIVTFDCHSSAMKFFCGRTLTVPPELTSLMNRLIDESARNFHLSQYPLPPKDDAPIGGQQLIRIYLEEFLIRIMRNQEKHGRIETVFTSKDSCDNSLVGELCDYLSEKADSNLTLRELTDRFHFGRSHLCDVFKKCTGYTILQYHTKLRMDRAKKLLSEGNMSISGVSEALGYESPAYFSRTFRRYTGMSPTDFKGVPSDNATVYLEKDTPLI